MPPNDNTRRPLVPSESGELTRTDPLGALRNGFPEFRDANRLTFVSVSKPLLKYAECRPARPPFQLVRSPLCPGSSLTDPDAGDVRFHDPLADRLNAWPVREPGGARLSVPNKLP